MLFKQALQLIVMLETRAALLDKLFENGWPQISSLVQGPPESNPLMLMHDFYSYLPMVSPLSLFPT